MPSAQLINASHSLPFWHPDYFSELWRKICAAVEPNGRFVGHLFGVQDDWAVNPQMNFHTRRDVERLFTNFELERFEEIERDGETVAGVLKHWHIFLLVGRRIVQRDDGRNSSEQLIIND